MTRKGIELILKAKNGLARGLAAAQKSLKKFGKAAKAALKGAFVGAAATAAALFKAAEKAEAFNKQVGQVATLADVSIGKVKKQIRGLSSEFGLAADALTEGLYNALSAGVPKENAFEFLRTASKTAIAGATDTNTAVDLLTTALNAYGMEASQAGDVSDKMFTAVRLGKTTIGELGANFAQVAPLAASAGIKMEEVLAATATLTKQGTPTAQAMTQIRASILAANKVLGDGWSDTMTYQEGMAAIAKQAGGSQNRLKEMVGRVEAVNAVLGVTGANASGAADDLAELRKSAGATEGAFAVMADTNPLEKVKRTIEGLVTAIGDQALTAFGPMLNRIAESARALQTDGRLEQWGENLKMVFKGLVPLGKGVAKMFAGIKTAIARASGFAGALAGGASIKEAMQQVKDLEAEEERAQKKRLEAVAAQEQAEQAKRDAESEREKERLAAITVEKEAKRDAARAERVEFEKAQAAQKKADKERKVRIKELKGDVKDLEKERADAIKRQADAEKKAREDAAKEDVDAAQKKLDQVQELAKMRVGEFVQQQQAAEEEKRGRAEDDKREARLEAKVKRGTRLSKRDQEFLDAARKIREAKEVGLGQAAADVQQAKDKLERVQDDQLKSLQNIEIELGLTKAELVKLIPLG